MIEAVCAAVTLDEGGGEGGDKEFKLGCRRVGGGGGGGYGGGGVADKQGGNTVYH